MERCFSMSKSSFLKDLAAQLTRALPSQVTALKSDFEKQCQLILNKTFQTFDIVTREEFDTQTKVLARTRKKIEELEKHIQDLEALYAKRNK